MDGCSASKNPKVGGRRIAFSPDGKLLARGSYDTEKGNSFARVWEVETAKDFPHALVRFFIAPAGSRKCLRSFCGIEGLPPAALLVALAGFIQGQRHPCHDHGLACCPVLGDLLLTRCAIAHHPAKTACPAALATPKSMTFGTGLPS